VGYFFQSGLARRAINYAGGGTNISNLNQGVLSEIEVPTPPLPEQRKIAEILSAWDEALEKLDALIQAKERRKKALMQQLLTGKKRVKGFSEPWPLMGMLEVFNRIDRTVQGTPEYVLSITAGTGFVDQRVKFSRVIAGRNIENYILLRKGEFSYNKGNSDRFPQGCIYRLEEFNEGAVPNVWISFELKSNGYSQLFYKHFFLSGGLNHQLNQIINAGVRNDGLLNLTASNFFTVRVPVPQPEEQKKLGELFEFIDRELRLMRAQRDALGKR
jgi:type I restriction enzyme S subunit